MASSPTVCAKQKPHACTMCEARFVSPSKLTLHMRTHTGERPYQCAQCCSKFRQAVHLKKHMEIHTGERTFTCQECFQRYRSAAYLRIHMRRHTGERPYKCSKCPAAFKQSSNLACHMITHSNIKPFRCKVCAATFISAAYLKRHVQRHTEARPYHCALCLGNFKSKYTLRMHMFRHTQVREFLCAVCSARFNCQGNLTKHMRTHTGEKRYKCTVCSKAFVQSSNLQSHLRTHSGERPFKCPECPARFSQTSHLKVHVSIHGGLKPFKCPACPSTFSRLDAMKRHHRIHTGERPYQCQKCSSSFRHPHHLKGHMAMHGQGTPLQCPHCPKTCKTSVNLRLHVQIHSEQRLFKCTTCSASFKRLHHLQRHSLIHSGERSNICNICGLKFGRADALRIHMFVHMDKRPFKCDICSKSMHSAHAHEEHMLLHGTERKFKCEHCSMRFKLRKYLARHIRRNHEGKEEQPVVAVVPDEEKFKCEYCPVLFKRRRYMTQHVKQKHRSEMQAAYAATSSNTREASARPKVAKKKVGIETKKYNMVQVVRSDSHAQSPTESMMPCGFEQYYPMGRPAQSSTLVDAQIKQAESSVAAAARSGTKTGEQGRQVDISGEPQISLTIEPTRQKHSPLTVQATKGTNRIKVCARKKTKTSAQTTTGKQARTCALLGDAVTAHKINTKLAHYVTDKPASQAVKMTNRANVCARKKTRPRKPTSSENAITFFSDADAQVGNTDSGEAGRPAMKSNNHASRCYITRTEREKILANQPFVLLRRVTLLANHATGKRAFRASVPDKPVEPTPALSTEATPVEPSAAHVTKVLDEQGPRKESVTGEPPFVVVPKLSRQTGGHIDRNEEAGGAKSTLRAPTLRLEKMATKQAVVRLKRIVAHELPNTVEPRSPVNAQAEEDDQAMGCPGKETRHTESIDRSMINDSVLVTGPAGSATMDKGTIPVKYASSPFTTNAKQPDHRVSVDMMKKRPVVRLKRVKTLENYNISDPHAGQKRRVKETDHEEAGLSKASVVVVRTSEVSDRQTPSVVVNPSTEILNKQSPVVLNTTTGVLDKETPSVVACPATEVLVEPTFLTEEGNTSSAAHVCETPKSVECIDISDETMQLTSAGDPSALHAKANRTDMFITKRAFVRLRRITDQVKTSTGVIRSLETAESPEVDDREDLVVIPQEDIAQGGHTVSNPLRSYTKVAGPKERSIFSDSKADKDITTSELEVQNPTSITSDQFIMPAKTITSPPVVLLDRVTTATKPITNPSPLFVSEQPSHQTAGSPRHGANLVVGEQNTPASDKQPQTRRRQQKMLSRDLTQNSSVTRVDDAVTCGREVCSSPSENVSDGDSAPPVCLSELPVDMRREPATSVSDLLLAFGADQAKCPESITAKQTMAYGDPERTSTHDIEHAMGATSAVGQTTTCLEGQVGQTVNIVDHKTSCVGEDTRPANGKSDHVTLLDRLNRFFEDHVRETNGVSRRSVADMDGQNTDKISTTSDPKPGSLGVQANRTSVTNDATTKCVDEYTSTETRRTHTSLSGDLTTVNIGEYESSGSDVDNQTTENNQTAVEDVEEQSDRPITANGETPVTKLLSFALFEHDEAAESTTDHTDSKTDHTDSKIDHNESKIDHNESKTDPNDPVMVRVVGQSGVSDSDVVLIHVAGQSKPASDSDIEVISFDQQLKQEGDHSDVEMIPPGGPNQQATDHCVQVSTNVDASFEEAGGNEERFSPCIVHEEPMQAIAEPQVPSDEQATVATLSRLLPGQHGSLATVTSDSGQAAVLYREQSGQAATDDDRGHDERRARTAPVLPAGGQTSVGGLNALCDLINTHIRQHALQSANTPPPLTTPPPQASADGDRNVGQDCENEPGASEAKRQPIMPCPLHDFTEVELHREATRRCGILKCACDTYFTDSTLFAAHNCFHDADDPLLCSFCFTLSPDMYAFYEHIVDHCIKDVD